MSVNTMEATSASEILESMEGVRDSLTVGRVFGEPIEAEAPSCKVFDRPTGVWSGVLLDNTERLSLIAVFVVPLFVGLFLGDHHPGHVEP